MLLDEILYRIIRIRKLLFLRLLIHRPDNRIRAHFCDDTAEFDPFGHVLFAVAVHRKGMPPAADRL